MNLAAALPGLPGRATVVWRSSVLYEGVGDLPTPLSAQAFAEQCKQVFGVSGLRLVSADPRQRITRVWPSWAAMVVSSIPAVASRCTSLRDRGCLLSHRS